MLAHNFSLAWLLQRLSKVGHATLYKYTKVLGKANIITFDTGYFGRGHINLYEFNPNISEWRVPMVF
jgi:hypothetical protein